MGRVTALAFGIMLAAANAGSLGGVVTDESGEPLAKVPVCLRPAGDDFCTRIRSTDREGQYQFNGLKAGVYYQVSVYQDESANGRKFERFRTFVWEPLRHGVMLDTKNAAADRLDFSGKFNFSNFQRVLTLRGADFPELASLDLAADYIVLKVFLAPENEQAQPETIFLGQVTNRERLQIEASVPLSCTAIFYQIYSANLSLSGAIALAEG
jgi:hypothetical protein